MTKLHVISDGAQAWLDLTVPDYLLMQMNAELKAMLPHAGGDVPFTDGPSVIDHLAQLCYLKGYGDAMTATAAARKSLPIPGHETPPMRRLTPLEEAEQKVLQAPEGELTNLQASSMPETENGDHDAPTSVKAQTEPGPYSGT